jgi:hypothetical protein
MKRVATISPVRGCSIEELRTLAQITEEAGVELPIIPPFQIGNESRVDITKRAVRAYAN